MCGCTDTARVGAFAVPNANAILAFGESQRHTLGDLFTYNEDTNSFAFLSGSNASNHKVRSWCAACSR